MSAQGVAGKVVLVTGITSGIGRSVAEMFAERGALVVGCGRREDKGRAIADKVRVSGGDLLFVRADVSVKADCDRFVDAAIAAHGRVDVLVNNAGGSGSLVATAELAEDELDAVLRLNLHSALFCSQRVIPHMKRDGGGVILNIASVQRRSGRVALRRIQHG